MTRDHSPYEEALARLPSAYNQALRCSDSGMSDDEICRQLGVEPESLPSLLDLAHRKLRNEMARE
jgi:DNA-directed RNA polymerase specialized sigma24 family protein